MCGLIALLHKKGGNAQEPAVTMLKTLKHQRTEAFGVASSILVRIEKTVEALQKGSANSPVIVGSTFLRILENDIPQPLKLENAALVFDGRIYSIDKEITAEAIAKMMNQNREKTCRALTKRFDGDFAFTIAEHDSIIAGRDVMGMRPLYYGEDADFAALSSERKALWRIGIKKTASFPPGSLAVVDRNGFRFKPMRKLAHSRPKQITMHAATKKLQSLLHHSVKEGVSGLKEVAVAFSGGLDSSIIALLAKKSRTSVHLIHVSLKNQSETECAVEAAEKLKLPIRVFTYDEDSVREVLPKVLWMIEEPDPVKTAIGIPINWTAEKAAEMGFRVVLAGQGADELFGGYKRYVEDYVRFGEEKVQEEIFGDIARMYQNNLERDFKIFSFHGVEPRLPFATYQMAKFAIDLPIELKIEHRDNTLRKLVLRQTAKNIGLPQSIIEKPKRAIQYTTGVSASLRKLAKKKRIPLKEYLHETFREALKREDIA
jgi:asparagine synthase (glutamine-hydrolysing)